MEAGKVSERIVMMKTLHWLIELLEKKEREQFRLQGVSMDSPRAATTLERLTDISEVIRRLKADIEEVKATCGIEHINRRIDKNEAAEPVPDLFQQAPRAEDAGAAESAPTITRKLYESYFPNNDALARGAAVLPLWCQSTHLSGAVDEDRGHLLLFTLTGEARQRAMWVRG